MHYLREITELTVSGSERAVMRQSGAVMVTAEDVPNNVCNGGHVVCSGQVPINKHLSEYWVPKTKGSI